MVLNKHERTHTCIMLASKIIVEQASPQNSPSSAPITSHSIPSLSTNHLPPSSPASCATHKTPPQLSSKRPYHHLSNPTIHPFPTPHPLPLPTSHIPHTKQHNLPPKPIQRPPLPLKRIHHIQTSHRLPFRVLGIRDRVADEAFEERLEDAAGCFVDHCAR